MMPLEKLTWFVTMAAFAALMAAKTLIDVLSTIESSTDEKGA